MSREEHCAFGWLSVVNRHWKICSFKSYVAVLHYLCRKCEFSLYRMFFSPVVMAHKKQDFEHTCIQTAFSVSHGLIVGP